MDLPPIHQQLQQQLATHSKVGSTPQSPLDVSQIPIDKVLTAKVESTMLLSPNLLKTLQDRVQQLQPQLQEKQLDADLKAVQARTSQQIVHLLSKPEVFALKLSVANQSLLSFSETAYAPKDTLLLRKRSDGLLHIESKLLAAASGSAKLASSINQPIATGATTPTAPAATIAAQTREILSQTLKHNLPYQKPIADSLQIIDRIINQLAHTSSSATLSRDANIQLLRRLNQFLSILKPLAAVAKTAEQLSQPGLLKTQLQSSGPMLEARLRQQVGTLSTSSLPPTPKTPLAPNPLSTPSATAMPPPASSPNGEGAEKLLDTKAELLNALQKLDSFIQRGPPAAGQKNDGNMDKVLQQLFSGQSLIKPKTDEINNKLTLALAEKLKPLLHASLARINTLQIHQLINNAQDAASSRAGGLFELPVRFGENLYPLVISIEERVYHEKEKQQENTEKQKENTSLKKRWHVFMEFDLDELGSFACEITVVDHSIKTRFWVQKNALWLHSRAHLNELKSGLENSGLQVEEIICQQGEAPKKNLRLEQSLVDIRT